jgi:hypothetical protein
MNLGIFEMKRDKGNELSYLYTNEIQYGWGSIAGVDMMFSDSYRTEYE